jgi:hypothetical protein
MIQALERRLRVEVVQQQLARALLCRALPHRGAAVHRGKLHGAVHGPEQHQAARNNPAPAPTLQLRPAEALSARQSDGQRQLARRQAQRVPPLHAITDRPPQPLPLADAFFNGPWQGALRHVLPAPTLSPPPPPPPAVHSTQPVRAPQPLLLLQLATCDCDDDASVMKTTFPQ